MEFFNRKEEVLDIQLTQYGKYLLSRGKFKPDSYAFFDDDVVYDNDYAGGKEIQNMAEKRLLEETPRLQPQYMYTGAETTIKKILGVTDVHFVPMKGLIDDDNFKEGLQRV